MISPENYEILFRLKDKSNFFINSFLLNGSLKFADPLIINKDGFWTFYLNKDGIKRIEQRGYDLFKDNNKFKKYSKQFYSYIQKANEEIIPKYQKINKIDAKKIKTLVNELSKLWYFYGFTEAVYHDHAYNKMAVTKNVKLKKTLNQNLDVLIDLKDKGRKVFNAFVMKNGIINKTLSQIETQNFLKARDASYLNFNELEILLNYGKIDDNTIKQRKNSYVIGLFNGELKMFDYVEASKLTDKFNDFEKRQYKKARKTITGVPVSGGVARGKVVISPMLDKKEAEKIAERMNAGDILVAQSTNPDLMLLCKKAGAIVTNQGGMLSHAAIISREMEKPCIVGTVFATKVLKDGDLVEVDANNGTVRILKKIKM